MKLPELEHEHTPSNRLHRWLDFFLHAGKLYNKKTGIGTCAICGQKIRYPQQYASSMITSAYYYSSGSVGLTLLLMHFLKSVMQCSNWYIWGMSLLLGALLFLLGRRINTTFALARHDWVAIPEQEDAELEAAKQYKQDCSSIIVEESNSIFISLILIQLAVMLF